MYSDIRKESSAGSVTGSPISTFSSGSSVLATCNSFKEATEELGDRVSDATVVVSSLSSSEHTDLAACESFDFRLTLLHQLCKDSLTLSATNAFLHFDPI
uniref:Uncharacterized protein n=1 Tax=Opuntia streptacantha TaxID=393608 RepID=A0A7C9CBW3_OPUST